MRVAPENWKGRWFRRIGWRVFPKTRESKVRALIKARKDEYHHQLEWSLDEIDSHSKSQSRLIAKEFLTAVRAASEDSPLLLGVSQADRRKHGWKHTTYSDVENLARKALRPPSAAMRFDEWEISEIKNLFSQALNRDPESVARLTYLIPEGNEKQRVADYFMGVHVAAIPSVGDLAAEYVTTIYREPNSRAAQDARRKIELLVTKKMVKGLKLGPGKPAISIHRGYLREASLASQSLVEQMREVNTLLAKYETSPDSCNQVMAQLYPWIAKLREGREPLALLSFLEMRPSEAASYIVQTVIGISPSKIEKTRYRNRPPKRPHK